MMGLLDAREPCRLAPNRAPVFPKSIAQLPVNPQCGPDSRSRYWTILEQNQQFLPASIRCMVAVPAVRRLYAAPAAAAQDIRPRTAIATNFSIALQTVSMLRAYLRTIETPLSISLVSLRSEMPIAGDSMATSSVKEIEKTPPGRRDNQAMTSTRRSQPIRAVGRKDITMRARNSSYPHDAVNALFITAGSRRSASIELLGSSTSAGQDQGRVQSRRAPTKLRDEMAELLTEIDGLPVLVCLVITDIPADVRSSFLPRGNGVHSLPFTALEKMVDRVRGSSAPSDAPSRPAPALVELISDGAPLAQLPAPSNETVLRVGPLELDLLDRSAKRGDRKIDLRPREFQLLKYMMQRSDNLVTRATLFKEVWRYRFVPETNLVDVHMGRLRRKVDGPNESPLIRNIRGTGFVLGATPGSLSSPSKSAQQSENLAAEVPRSVQRAAL
jgi:DNA-binding winged helix-turn-helix (wHTH) protein